MVHKKLRLTAIVLCMMILASNMALIMGCGNQSGIKGYSVNQNLDTSAEVVLRIASDKDTWPEMDNVITKFEEIYPNCTIVCECIEEYPTNLPIRLEQEELKIDVFKCANIQETTEYKDKAYNLLSDHAKEFLDLSGTNDGLVENFKYMEEDNVQYSIPYGGELRGMYVNTTLLDMYNLKIPTNRAELMECCEVFYNEGYIPLQSSSGTFAQQLLYPYICNSIVNGGNYEETYQAIENIDDGVSEYFRDPYSLLYEIVEKGYFDYKRSEEELGYFFEGSDGKARDFLNVIEVSEDVYEKQDDIGKIPFMIDTQAFGNNLEKTKSDYHSTIEYQFILSPVGVDGGYAYLSPADGLAINNQSDHLDWSLEFMNFIFTPEVNKAFAEESGKIPNTKDALVQFDVAEDHTCDVGQVTFSYGFYKTITPLMLGGYDDMIGISKMNAEKYMEDNGDGTYRIKYSLEDYMARLEKEFQAVKETR